MIKCHWSGSPLANARCSGEATEFLQHPDLNQSADEEIWMMPLCNACAQKILALPGLIRLSKEEYLAYNVMTM